MRIAPLLGRNSATRFTLVDAEDYDWVMSRRWSYSKQRWAGNWRTGRLHRALLEHHGHDLTGRRVDHCDGWTLDNRKVNLTAFTEQETRKHSGQRNIHCSGNKWCVRLGQLVVGRYDSEEEADAAYEQAARDAGFVTARMRTELLAPVLEQLEAWVAEGLIVRNIPGARLIEDRYRLRI